MRSLIITAVLTLALASPAAAKNMYVPAAATTPGAQGTFWTTDLRIFNPSTDLTISVSLHFIPAGSDGSNISGQLFSIAPRGTIVLDDVVAQLWPFFTGIGTVRIDSDTDRSYEFVASSRTYNTAAGKPGTYGQFVPAEDAVDGELRTVILHIRSTPEFRTNLGAMNPTREPATVVFRLIGTDGVVFSTSAPHEVPPMGMIQMSITDIFGGLYAANGTVTVEASQPVFTWASVIDNLTGDAIYVHGERDSAE